MPSQRTIRRTREGPVWRRDGDPGYDYVARVDAAGLTVRRGTVPEPDARVVADSTAWTRVLYEAAEPAEAGVDVAGDPAAVARLVALFDPAP